MKATFASLAEIRSRLEVTNDDKAWIEWLAVLQTAPPLVWQSEAGDEPYRVGYLF